MFEIAETKKTVIEKKGVAKIKVLGVGGAGCNAVNTMINSSLQGVEYIVANTDAQALEASLAPTKIQLGEKITKGLGAGSNPEVGKQAALEEYDKLRSSLEDADMVFITAGMGGGTGTGAAPVIAQLAKELGVLTVGVVTKPFGFEGKRRFNQGLKGIETLKNYVDSLIIIPNQKLLDIAGEKLSITETFQKADEVLLHAVQGITDLIHNTGLINADFADVSTIMKNKGMALMGTAMATGEGRALMAAKSAITSPLLEDINIVGATGIIINITGSNSLTTHEINQAVSLVMEAADEDAEIIFGTVINDDMGDALKVTVIATGLELKESLSQPKIITPKPVVTNSAPPPVPPILEPTPQPNPQPVMIMAEETVVNEELTVETTFLEAEEQPEPEIIASTPEPEPIVLQSTGGRVKSIEEKLGFINFDDEEFDTPAFLRRRDGKSPELNS